MSQPASAPKNGRERVRALARVVIAVDDQIGTDTLFRFGTGRPVTDAPDIPRVELPEWAPNAQWSLIQAKAVERQGKIRVYHHHGSRNTHSVQTYELRQWAVDTARETVETQESVLPCGHEGIDNRRDGGFRCTFDGCDAEFSRAEVDL